MAHLPKIHLLNASDAPQHLGIMIEILHKLKTEKRIGDFYSLAADKNLSNLHEKIEDGDLVLILLTLQLEPHRERIEEILSELHATKADLSVAEVLVDNLTYDNRHITFPVDLKPIRSRVEMDAVWSSIEESLKEMFPAKKRQDPLPLKPYWSKSLKLAGIIIALIVAFFLLKELFNGNNDSIRVEKVEVEEVQEAEAEEMREAEAEENGSVQVEQEMMQEAEDKGN